MRQSILNYLDAHKILVDCHHGLRAKCSCETQLLTLSHELAYNLHKGIQTNLIILDFSKAFDKVPHNKLLMKMENYGIRGNTWRWVRSFLSDRNRFYWMVKSQVKSTTSSQWCTTRISIGPFCFWYSSMTFQHQFHLNLDFSQMTVYCTGAYTQKKTVKSCKKTYIALKSGRKRGVWNSIRWNVTRCILQEQDTIWTSLHS
jgi:hypothetical protein